MTAFKDFKFIKEFACRTQLNYFRLKADYTENHEMHEAAQRELERIEAVMREKGYPIAQCYEVTQLVNSIVGLLIFPQQGYYTTLEKNEAVNKIQMPTLYKYIQNGLDGKTYKNTYNGEDPQVISSVLRHLRNSTSHNRMGVQPQSASGKEITHICFKDKKKDDNDEWREFELIIDVNDLEPILLEISNYIINLPV